MGTCTWNCECSGLCQFEHHYSSQPTSNHSVQTSDPAPPAPLLAVALFETVSLCQPKVLCRRGVGAAREVSSRIARRAGPVGGLLQPRCRVKSSHCRSGSAVTKLAPSFGRRCGLKRQQMRIYTAQAWCLPPRPCVSYLASRFKYSGSCCDGHNSAACSWFCCSCARSMGSAKTASCRTSPLRREP